LFNKKEEKMAQNKITWLSHACFSIETSQGKTILIDPWLTDNPLSPVSVADIDKADVILVTHDHFDHCGDAVAISQKTGGIVVGFPETVGKFKTGQALPEGNVVSGGMGMNIGGTVDIAGIGITMTQAFHSTESGAPCGYILTLEDGTAVYHAGDTGIFESMKTLGDLYSIDVALLPIGSCFTMDPYQAAWALKLLRPKKVIPMHYRTFPLLIQDADGFVEKAKELAPDVEVVVLNPGDTHLT
jgi:L-ascorbate metabolism protein UlaG (beta-lactamase superfamily)